mmetsp:Transcript_143/g.519  ORF Transcript_143/g.519 Transcript_143/m.519 type:complete len:334 (-) Transcript_143:125-1126(-)
MAEIEELHRLACERREETYVDPASGLTVFTEYAHRERGACCGCGCRHCPYRKTTTAPPPKTKKAFGLVKLWLLVRSAWLSLLSFFLPNPTKTPPPPPPPRRSKVYTKRGDAGSTQLLFGETPKFSEACEALGDVDELNVRLGFADRACGRRLSLVKARLRSAQLSLLQAGAVIAASGAEKDDSGGVERRLGNALHGFDEATMDSLEHEIDFLDSKLPKLANFVLPRGDGPLAALALHDARVVCRRAERRVWRLVHADDDACRPVAVFLNRLSDFLFVAARAANHDDDDSRGLFPRFFFGWFGWWGRRRDNNNNNTVPPKELSYDVKRGKLHAT